MASLDIIKKRGIYYMYTSIGNEVFCDRCHEAISVSEPIRFLKSYARVATPIIWTCPHCGKAYACNVYDDNDEPRESAEHVYIAPLKDDELPGYVPEYSITEQPKSHFGKPVIADKDSEYCKNHPSTSYTETHYVAVDKDGNEAYYASCPTRNNYMNSWEDMYCPGCNDEEDEWVDTKINLPIGTIFKMTGKTLTWEDEPLAIKIERK